MRINCIFMYRQKTIGNLRNVSKMLFNNGIKKHEIPTENVTKYV